MAGDDELAALDLQLDLVGVDAGELGVDDRARRVALVEDVDGRREAAAAARREARAVEDVAEQLVHLAPHPLEVGEEVALRSHGAPTATPLGAEEAWSPAQGPELPGAGLADRVGAGDSGAGRGDS